MRKVAQVRNLTERCTGPRTALKSQVPPGKFRGQIKKRMYSKLTWAVYLLEKEINKS